MRWALESWLLCPLLQTHEGDVRLTVVYIPTNHVYVGDIYFLDERDIIHTNLTVREGLGEYSNTHLLDVMLMCKPNMGGTTA